MSRIGICYTVCCLANQSVAPNPPGFQGIKGCIQFMNIPPRKIIFYPSNCYDGSNVIRLAWSGHKVE